MSDSESGSRSSTSINGDYQANNSDNEKIDAERLANNGKDFEDEDISSENDAEGSEALKGDEEVIPEAKEADIHAPKNPEDAIDASEDVGLTLDEKVISAGDPDTVEAVESDEGGVLESESEAAEKTFDVEDSVEGTSRFVGKESDDEGSDADGLVASGSEGGDGLDENTKFDREEGRERSSAASSNKATVSPIDTLDNVDDHIELDYDDDNIDLTDAPLITSKQDEVLEEPKMAKRSKSKHEKEEGEESSEEGELSSDEEDFVVTKKPEEEAEDGEIQDGRKGFARTEICRFFAKGSCTWGYSCRFLHPGVNDKGNYQLIERPGMGPPNSFRQSETAEEPEVAEGEKEKPEPPPEHKGPPKPETPWERGLRQAKEALKRASRKKEMELDIEDKKMNLSLDDVKNRDGDGRSREAIYDRLDYDELDPIQATGFEEYQHNDDWERAGFEEPDENFDVEWTHANYELPHLHHPPGPPQMMRDWPDDRPFRDKRLERGRRAYERGNRRRQRSPNRQNKRGYRDDYSNRQGLNRQAFGAEGWVDPWQRVKPGDRRRQRRRSSSGSSSFSSLSRSSRGSSISSFSSRSRSRTRTPTPLRNIAKPKPKPQLSQNAANKEKAERQADFGRKPIKKGPDWPPVGAKDKQASGHKSSTTADKGEKESNEVTSTSHRVSRKDNKSRKERFKRRRHSLSSSSSSSHSSSGTSRSRSSSSSSTGSSSSSDSSSSSSGSSTSDIDSDDLYADLEKISKVKKKTKKPAMSTKSIKSPATDTLRRPQPSSNRPPNNRSQGRGTTTTSSKAGIKLTLVNKSKVQAKKRVLESPPPEPQPPAKKSNLPIPDKSNTQRGGQKPTSHTMTKSKAQVSPVKSAGVSSKPHQSAASKKSQPNRREELLKQLKAVEDAIAKKRSNPSK